ncbi:hypothetical protein J4Q44_G00097060 [Coregonus suidteri]|uniref:Secreted protein n=1 Tax=Coregonus suidteri TaxID=861788 RepID=A0AAN8QZQ1_9TELE
MNAFLATLLCRWLLSEVGASRSVGGWEGECIHRIRRGTDLPGSKDSPQHSKPSTLGPQPETSPCIPIRPQCRGHCPLNSKNLT